MSTPIVQEDALRVHSSRAFDLTQNGNMWLALVYDDGADSSIRFFRSTDSGGTWSEDVASEFVKGSVSPGNGQGFKSYSFYIDKDDYAHIVYRASVNQYAYRRGTPDTNRTSWTWSSEFMLNTNITQIDGSPDVVAHREVGGTGWKVHAFFPSYSSGFMAAWKVISITSGGTITVPSGEGTKVNTVSFGGASSGIDLRLDFRHDQADHKVVQSSTPSIYFFYASNGATGQFFKKSLYSGGSYFFQAERTIENVDVQNDGAMTAFYDGTRFVMFWANQSTQVVNGAERDEADTATTTRNPATTSGANIQGLSAGYDGSNQDVYVFCRESTNDDPEKIKFTRSGATWSAWSNVDADTADAGISSGGLITVPRSGATGLSVVYSIFDVAPDIVRWENIFNVYGNNPITLQAVASLTAALNGTYDNPGTLLQAVATVTPAAGLTFNAPVTLQAVAFFDRLVGSIVPKTDYTVYDGYLESSEFPEIYGLIYYEDESSRSTERSQPLRPPRSDVGNQDTEVRPESGEVFSQTDFSHGAGQLYFHHEGRDVRRYLWSEGFDTDIDTVGQAALLEHLPDVLSTNPTIDWSSDGAGKLEVFNDLLFVNAGTGVSRASVLPGGWTPEDPMAGEGAGQVYDISSSGEHLYAGLGSQGIHRRTTAGTWSHYSDTPAIVVAWIKSRLMAASAAAIYEVVSGGAAPTAIETLPGGWKFTSIFEVGGFAYATVINETDGQSRVHTYGLNSAGTAIEKKSETPAPRNQLFRTGIGYLGVAFLGGGIVTPDGGYDPVLYQGAPEEGGSLSYLKLVEGEGSGGNDLSIRAIVPSGENLIFGYSTGAEFAFGTRDGLGMFKLKNGAIVPYLKTNDAAPAGRQIKGLTLYDGKVVFSTRGGGVWHEDNEHIVQTAYAISSIADWQTTALKVWDLFQVSHEPLPLGTSVQLHYTTELPSANDWNLVISNGVFDSDQATNRVYDVQAASLAVKLVSNGSSDRLRAPTRQGFLVRSNVLPETPEWQLVRFVRVMKKDRKDNGAEDVYISNTHSRKKDFQKTAYKWVTLYEPGVTWTVRVAQIANVTPLLPRFWETAGEERNEVYVLQMTLEGVRD